MFSLFALTSYLDALRVEGSANLSFEWFSVTSSEWLRDIVPLR